MILFVVARTRLDRYEVLRGQFGHSPEVRIVLDRREGERRALESKRIPMRESPGTASFRS